MNDYTSREVMQMVVDLKRYANPQVVLNPVSYTHLLEMDFYAEGREQEATLLLDEKRHAVLNGIPLPSACLLYTSRCV